MSDMKKLIFPISKIILCLVTIPLWFVKMFIDIGHLPDKETGQIVKVVFRYSMLENIGALAHPSLAYIVMVLALIATIMNTLVLKFSNNKLLRITANIAFGIAIGLFLLLQLLASTVARGY